MRVHLHATAGAGQKREWVETLERRRVAGREISVEQRAERGQRVGPAGEILIGERQRVAALLNDVGLAVAELRVQVEQKQQRAAQAFKILVGLFRGRDPVVRGAIAISQLQPLVEDRILLGVGFVAAEEAALRAKLREPFAVAVARVPRLGPLLVAIAHQDFDKLGHKSLEHDSGSLGVVGVGVLGGDVDFRRAVAMVAGIVRHAAGGERGGEINADAVARAESGGHAEPAREDGELTFAHAPQSVRALR